MAFLTEMNYRMIARGIINLGGEYDDVAQKLENTVVRLIPSRYSGQTASYIKNLANQLTNELGLRASAIRSIGYTVKNIAENEDID